MATPQGTIRLHRRDQTATLQVEGRATMAQGLAVRRFADQNLGRGTITLRVDLRHCTFADSTFLGTLLFLKRAVERCGQGEFAVLCPSPECSRAMGQMGLDTLLPTRNEEEPTEGPWTELNCGTEDVPAFQRTVVQAHQELAALPGPVGDVFRNVTRRLEQEIDANQKK
jgi:anti-anti-sigma factor